MATHSGGAELHDDPSHRLPNRGDATLLDSHLFGSKAFRPRFSGACIALVFAFIPAVEGFPWINAIEHRPTYRPNKDDRSIIEGRPPTDVRQTRLLETGDDPEADSSVRMSKFQHIGCFQADLSIQDITSPGFNFDPNACKEYCEEQYPNRSHELIVAIHEARCACELTENIGDIFTEVDSSRCTHYCRYYMNPICGGDPDYWGVFMEYDFQSLGAQGAYDPFRYTWYTVVAVKELRIYGGYSLPNPDTTAPERYYLHAVDIYSGEALFQYQLVMPGVIYGLQYDIDNSRLVGLLTPQSTGRLRNDVDWSYFLCTIHINTTFPDRPYLMETIKPIKITEEKSSLFMGFNGASAILSKDVNVYIFTQVHPVGSMKNEMTDRVYLVKIPDGQILEENPLDFKVLQFFANEKYGDVSAIGPRNETRGLGMVQTYVKLCRVTWSNIENATVVNWQYSMINPERLAPTSVTGFFLLYPGVSSSEHLYNKSAIAHRYIPPDDPSKGALTIFEVNIRTKTGINWCNETCQGTVFYETPYAGIFNREPGIPLSLKSPSLEMARFSVDANEITVDFDRNTMKGALPIYVDSPFVPVSYNESMIPDGDFDCALVLDDVTVVKIGGYPDTYCNWQSARTLLILLPAVINITFGDSIFVKPDTLYSVPLDGEHSQAASGGIQVEKPFPPEAPVILLRGSTSLDKCSPASLQATGTRNLGKWQDISWHFPPDTEEDPNPVDLTNSPFRVFDEGKLEELRSHLEGLSENNSFDFFMPANVFEDAAVYKIQLSITSRWELTTNKTVSFRKMSFAMPAVSVEGADVIFKRRTDTVSLSSRCIPSSCDGEEDPLAYNWAVGTGNLDFNEFPEIVTNTKDLIIRPFVLEPLLELGIDETVNYHEYNFTVSCYVDTPTGNTPDQTATASVSVRVLQSPILAVFRSGGRKVQKSQILVLDASSSQDPDYPTADGQTFAGTFKWSCLSESNTACFGGAASGDLEPPPLLRCRLDPSPNNKFQDGLVMFYKPLFDELEYCEYARGILMVLTTNMNVGDYQFTVEATTYDGRRTDEQDAMITITDDPVLKIACFIEGTDLPDKFSVTKAIRISGTVEGGAKEDLTPTYSWKIEERGSNPKYQPEMAAEMANDPNNQYTESPLAWLPAKLDITDTAKFSTSPLSPTAVIKANVLKPSTEYRFTLTAFDGEAEGSGDVTFMTAGMPPRNGRLECEPLEGDSTIPRTLSAPGWTANDQPLSYYFGYESPVVEGGEPSKVMFTSEFIPVTILEVSSMRLGDEADNYTLRIFVIVQTSYGATTTTSIEIKSFLPSNITDAVLNGLDNAGNADGASVISDLSGVVELDPNNVDVANQVIDILNEKTDDIPATPSQYTQQAALLAQLINSGHTGDNVLDAMENLIIGAAASDSFSLEPDAPGGALADIAFHSLGGLLPQDSSLGATGQSLTMQKFRTPNPSFTHRNIGGEESTMEDVDLLVNRQPINHPQPKHGTNVIDQCPTIFCDRPLLICDPPNSNYANSYICCDTPNPKTFCLDAPCWFHGRRCRGSRGPRLNRRLGRQQLALVGREGDQSSVPKVEANEPALLTRKNQRRSSRNDGVASSATWFDSWSRYNFPLHELQHTDASDYDKAKAFQGWHPDIYERRLTFAKVNRTQSDAERLLVLEETEEVLNTQAEEDTRNAVREKLEVIKADAAKEMAYNSMSPTLMARMRAQSAEENQIKYLNKMEKERNESQRITRINVMRDTIAKRIITKLSRKEVKKYTSSSFTLYIGKTTNLSNVHSSFIFPKQFQVPADSPDEPTPNNNVTGFAFEYVEYNRNIYSWSDSTPDASRESMLVSLIVLKANARDLDFRSTPEPITVYADYSLFSNAICLYWDRFASNTPGGAWSSQGIVNDGEGCLTTHLTDVGVFMEGKVMSGTELVDVASPWEREVWETECVGCANGNNLVVVVVLGMVLFTNMLLIMLGYVVDETRRTDMKSKNAARYHLDGDGLTGPINIEDPIAYSVASNPVGLAIGTLLNVTKREHALFSVIFYHENFTRPQRLQCFTSLLTGLLAVNAAVHSYPGYYQEAGEWVISGVLSGLILFPVYCSLLLMFNMRPRPIKKKLVKKATSTLELELNRKRLQDLVNETAMLPKAGYAKIPALVGPYANQYQPPGSMLGIAAPLPLPPLPPNQAGGSLGITGNIALPSMPPGMTGGLGSLGGLSAMGGAMALPALPGMTANLPLPPPPSYPPPPKQAQLTLPSTKMPPLNFPKLGPPPAPFPLAALTNDGSMGAKNPLGPFDAQRGQPLEVTADTGATPSAQLVPALPPTAHGPPTSFGNSGVEGGATQAAIEAAPALPGIISDDPQHRAPPTPGIKLPVAAGPPREQTPPSTGGRPQPGAGVGFSPSSSHRGSVGGASSAQGSTAQGNIRLPPPPPHQMVPQSEGPLQLFIRAQPPADMAPPFTPTPAGPAGLSLYKPPGLPPPGMTPPIPTMRAPGAATIPLAPLVPPPPPPPPNEEERAFVRRVRYTYYDKVVKEAEKHALLEDYEELSMKTPGWVYDTMTFMPYLACLTFTLASIFVVLQYGVKFAVWQEERWIMGSLLGLCLVLVILELFRIVMMTLVELRKFENRSKAKSGYFMPRRVDKDDGSQHQVVPPPRLMKRAAAVPQVPKGAKPPAMKTLNPPGAALPPMAPPAPPQRPANTNFSAASIRMTFSEPPPPKQSASPMRSSVGRSPLPTPPGSGRGGSSTPVGSEKPPRIVGGSSPHNSSQLDTLNQSLTTVVKAKASGQKAPPPPSKGGPVPPPPPADQAPNYNRNRPSSASSGSSAPRRIPPPRGGQ
eukprot:TRINITY_DN27142_c0_g1_i1.p1 TRINITY_DN27142_c0_g1~~TRINITY_DN27142_c0_g1_i1.p1  ORF type:complete len:2814 (+),score=350.13 TRINITY_DN27142_c0_g1_i1:234-8675(+)